MGDTIEKLSRWKLDCPETNIGVLGTLSVVVAMLGAIGYLGYLTVQPHTNRVQREQQQIPSSLAPAAVYINPKLYPDRITPKNEDVNGDGTYESVLYFTNPLTGTLEQQLIEKCGENVCFRPFRVEQGEIVYLEERCGKE